MLNLERKIKGLPLVPKCNDLYTLLKAVKVKDYKCPKCGKYHNDNDGGYEVDKVKYPIYYNESKGGTMDGNYWDWDEVHCCEECNSKYYFNNGAY